MHNNIYIESGWYWFESENYRCIFKIDHFAAKEVGMVYSKKCYWDNGKVSEKRGMLEEYIKGLATHEQIEYCLKTYAERNGYVEGVKIKSKKFGFYELQGFEEYIITFPLKLKGNEETICDINDIAINPYGKWALIVEEKTITNPKPFSKGDKVRSTDFGEGVVVETSFPVKVNFITGNQEFYTSDGRWKTDLHQTLFHVISEPSPNTEPIIVEEPKLFKSGDKVFSLKHNVAGLVDNFFIDKLDKLCFEVIFGDFATTGLLPFRSTYTSDGRLIEDDTTSEVQDLFHYDEYMDNLRKSDNRYFIVSFVFENNTLNEIRHGDCNFAVSGGNYINRKKLKNQILDFYKVEESDRNNYMMVIKNILELTEKDYYEYIS